MHTRYPLILFLALVAGCASQSAIQSEYNLGVDSYKSQNYASARVHWQAAVQTGEPLAMNNLGYLLFSGLGGPPDVAGAVELWTKAAKAGNSESQWHLGKAYEAGTGVPQSLAEAYAWYRCSIASAELNPDDETEAEIAKDSRKSLATLLGKLPSAQLETSEELARQRIVSYAKRPGA